MEEGRDDVVSLSSELGCIVVATEAMRSFMDRLPAYPEEQGRGLSQLMALAALIACRVRLVKAVVQGEDPVILRASHNSMVAESIEGDDPDMKLAPWTAAEKLQHHQAEIDRALRQEAAEKGDQAP